MDEIVDLMEQLPVINKCYQTWWELQCQVEDFYSEKERQRPPLSQQKEFRSIKNAIIQEAQNIRMGTVTFEDTSMDESTEFSGLSYNCWELWMVTQDDTAPIEDRDEATAQYELGMLLLSDNPETHDAELGIQWLEYATRNGSDCVVYRLDKEYLKGEAVNQDASKAVAYLTQSADAGNQYAQFFLDRRDSPKPPSIMLSVTRLLHHMCALPTAEARTA